MTDPWPEHLTPDHRPPLVPLDHERHGDTEHMDRPVVDRGPLEDVPLIRIGIAADDPTRAREVSGEVVVGHLTAPRG